MAGWLVAGGWVAGWLGKGKVIGFDIYTYIYIYISRIISIFHLFMYIDYIYVYIYAHQLYGCVGQGALMLIPWGMASWTAYCMLNFIAKCFML